MSMNFYKNFDWTKKQIEKARKLNTILTKMQTQIVEQVKENHKIFSDLEKNGLDFLRGFKVTGRYCFEKDNSCEIWQVIYDSEINDFLPLSKMRINTTFSYPISPLPEEADFPICSYLYYLLSYGKISYEDLLKCTEEDFCPDVFVTLNYPLNELERFPYYNGDIDMIYDILENRRHLQNSNFQWNEKNIQKIIEVNSWIWKRDAEMKQYIAEIRDALHADKFYIEGQIEYHGSKATDIATIELQKQQTKYAMFQYYSISCFDDKPEIRDSFHDESINHNCEVFYDYLSEEQRKIPFHYFMHLIFIDDNIYSFEDLVRMNENDFKVCLYINISE